MDFRRWRRPEHPARSGGAVMIDAILGGIVGVALTIPAVFMVGYEVSDWRAYRRRARLFRQTRIIPDNGGKSHSNTGLLAQFDPFAPSKPWSDR